MVLRRLPQSRPSVLERTDRPQLAPHRSRVYRRYNTRHILEAFAWKPSGRPQIGGLNRRGELVIDPLRSDRTEYLWRTVHAMNRAGQQLASTDPMGSIADYPLESTVPEFGRHTPWRLSYTPHHSNSGYGLAYFASAGRRLSIASTPETITLGLGFETHEMAAFCYTKVLDRQQVATDHYYVRIAESALHHAATLFGLPDQLLEQRPSILMLKILEDLVNPQYQAQASLRGFVVTTLPDLKAPIDAKRTSYWPSPATTHLPPVITSMVSYASVAALINAGNPYSPNITRYYQLRPACEIRYAPGLGLQMWLRNYAEHPTIFPPCDKLRAMIDTVAQQCCIGAQQVAPLASGTRDICALAK